MVFYKCFEKIIRKDTFFLNVTFIECFVFFVYFCRRFRQEATGNRQQARGKRQQGTGNREQATGNRQQGTGNRELFVKRIP